MIATSLLVVVLEAKTPMNQMSQKEIDCKLIIPSTRKRRKSMLIKKADKKANDIKNLAFPILS